LSGGNGATDSNTFHGTNGLQSVSCRGGAIGGSTSAGAAGSNACDHICSGAVASAASSAIGGIGGWWGTGGSCWPGGGGRFGGGGGINAGGGGGSSKVISGTTINGITATFQNALVSPAFQSGGGYITISW
jgi:hypothetical protein